MKRLRTVFFIGGFIFCLGFHGYAQSSIKEPKVILITLDGLRWQELFGGADSLLINCKKAVRNKPDVMAKYWRDDAQQRREQLFPFVWNEVAQFGTIYGNRWKKNQVNVKNGMHFSYPGYNEILVGAPDDARVNSNKEIYNPNVTLFEHINNLPEFKGKVLAFGGWKLFPYILNDQRSGIPVNAGVCPSLSPVPTEKELLLDEMQALTPVLWNSRFDVFTYRYALEALKSQKPRLMLVSFAETDGFGHDRRYDFYLHSSKANDQMFRSLWDYTQSDPFYKDQTLFIIATDHGRGVSDEGRQSWEHHDSVTKGSDEVWLVLFGADVEGEGEVIVSNTLYNDQIAATIAQFLNVDYQPEVKIGAPIPYRKKVLKP